MENNKIKILSVGLAVLIAALSFFWAGNHFSNPETYETTIETLDEKSGNVLALATSAAAVSTGISMIPSDIANPIANQFADLSSTMMLILSAILLEKYLLTLTGAVAFKILIPIACAVFIGFVILKSETCKVVALKLFVFAIAIVLLVPASTTATNYIEKTYEISIEKSLNEAENVTDELNSTAGEDEDNVLKKLANKVATGSKNVLNKAQTLFSDFIEIAALMIVTSCIMPIVTMLALIWLLNVLLGVNISTRGLKTVAKSGSKIREKTVAIIEGEYKAETE